MRRIILALPVLLAACGAVTAPRTPEQAVVELRAGLGTAAAAFNVYAGQRPFCDQPNAKAPPLCADRHVVIQGDQAAHAVADAIDRAEAIKVAIGELRHGDLLVIAGKGHETYQIVGKTKHPFDDSAVARAVVSEMRGAQ